ncbi:MAG: hypothetical protein ACK5LX_12830 [Oscillospiraceae bacterium]
MKNKLFALLLALLLILALGACTSEQPDAATESSAETSDSQAEESSQEEASQQVTLNNQPVQELETPGEEPYATQPLENDLLAYAVSPEQLEADLTAAFAARDLSAPERTARTESEDSEVVVYDYTVEGTSFLQVMSLPAVEGELVTQLTVSPGYLEDQEKEAQAAAYATALLDYFCPGKGAEILEKAREEADSWPTYQYGATLITASAIGTLDLFPFLQA